MWTHCLGKNVVFEIGRGTGFKSEHVGMGAQGNNIGHISKGGESGSN